MTTLHTKGTIEISGSSLNTFRLVFQFRDQGLILKIQKKKKKEITLGKIFFNPLYAKH